MDEIEQPCFACTNARCDSDLNDDNDLSYVSVGQTVIGFNCFIRSGDGRPVALIVQMFDRSRQVNRDVAWFYPRFCPICGRKLDEYAINERGRRA